MTHPCFFGYGSLVNRGTHTHENAHAAKALGWRRSWVTTVYRPRPYLTAVRAPGSEILGLVAEVEGSWDALDEREGAYERHVMDEIEHPLEAEREVRIYAINADVFTEPAPEPDPILLSYLDAVVQGYLYEFGLDGVRHFFDTTDGWHIPVRNDRAEPIYPRAQTLSQAEADLTLDQIKRVGGMLL